MAFKYAISNTYAHATFAAANSVVEVSNSIITITAGDGLSGGGSFGLNNPDNASVTLSATSSSGGGLSSGGGGLSISAGNGLFTNTEGLQIKANTGITVNQDGIFANGSALFPSINDTGTQTNLSLSDGYSYFPNTYLEVGKTQAPGTSVVSSQAVGLRLTAEANTISSNVSLAFGSLDTGNNGRHGAIINFKKEGLWTAGSGNYPGNLEFYTRPASGNQVLALVIDSTQNFDFQSGNITTTGILTVGSDTFTGDAPATIEIDASQYVAMNVRGYNANFNYEAPEIKLTKINGSKASPTATLSGDTLAYFGIRGHDGTSDRGASYLEVQQTAAIGVGQIQSSFRFWNGNGTGYTNTFDLSHTTADFKSTDITTTGNLTASNATLIKDAPELYLYDSDTALSDTEVSARIVFKTNDASNPDSEAAVIRTVGSGTTGSVDLQFLTGTVGAPTVSLEIGSNGTADFQGNAITTTGNITGNSLSLPTNAADTGLDFGSKLASSATAVDKHIDLWGGSYGINVTSGTINFVRASTLELAIQSGLIDAQDNNLTTTGALTCGAIISNGTSTTRAHLDSSSSGTSSVAQTHGGFLATATGMNTTSKYTPGYLFGSTDGNFTTTNPKMLAGMVGECGQTYNSDTTSAMGLAFFWTINNAGATPTPTLALRGAYNTGWDFQANDITTTGLITSASHTDLGGGGTAKLQIQTNGGTFMRLFNSINSGGMSFAGGDAITDGGRLTVRGSVHGGSPPIEFADDNVRVLDYGATADTWDFQAKNITTTGNITTNQITETSNLLTFVGTGTPVLEINSSAASSTDAELRIDGSRTGSSTSNIARISFRNLGDETAMITMRDPAENSGTDHGELVFRTAKSGTLTDQMIIHHDGLVEVRNGGFKVGDVKDVTATPSTYVFQRSDSGRTIGVSAVPSGGLVCNTNVFGGGETVTIYNGTVNDVTIGANTGFTLRLAGTTSTGDRTLAIFGVATILFIDGGASGHISGAGLS